MLPMHLEKIFLLSLLLSLALICASPSLHAYLPPIPEVGKACPIDHHNCCDPSWKDDAGKCCAIRGKEDYYASEKECSAGTVSPDQNTKLPVVIPLRDPADVALREYSQVWDEGIAEETDPDMAPVLTKYYAAGGDCGDLGSGGSWSAAFISYVMIQSGISFPASCAHINYFRTIQQHPGECQTYPMDKISRISKGDILCHCSARSGGSCYINYSDLPKGYASAHCDIVTSRNGNNIEIVGGNVASPDCHLPACDPNVQGVTVNKRPRDISNLNSQYFGYISCGNSNSGPATGDVPSPPPSSSKQTSAFCPGPAAMYFLALMAFILSKRMR